jgi:hypothetical protein
MWVRLYNGQSFLSLLLLLYVVLNALLIRVIHQSLHFTVTFSHIENYPKPEIVKSFPVVTK